MWRKHPGLTSMVVLTLALGIGVNTAVFRFVNSTLLRPLPFPEPHQLVQIKKELRYNDSPTVQRTDWTTFEEISAWTKASDLPVLLGAHTWLHANLAGKDGTERLECGAVSGTFLAAVGVPPVLGRDFLTQEDQGVGEPVVILSHDLWQRRFAGDPKILGHTLILDRQACSIIGVLPASLDIPGSYPLLIPMSFARRIGDREHLGTPRAFGRLRPGKRLAEAETKLNSLYQTAREPGEEGRILLVDLHEDRVRGVRRHLLLLWGAVGFVQLIACVNVANLLLARATGRRKEIALRHAMGAGRGRLLQQLLTESVLLALAGGLVGILISLWSSHAILHYLRGYSVVTTLPMDWRVMTFALGLSLGSGLLFGLAPALHTSRISLSDSLRESSASLTAGIRHHRLGHTLVVAEIALAVMLLLGAGLLLRSFLRLRAVDLGFRPSQILSFTVDLSRANYPEARTQSAFYEQLLNRLSSLPGVESVGVNSMLPLTQAGTLFVGLESETGVSGPSGAESGSGGKARGPLTCCASVNGDYFRLMGIPLLRGRVFTDADRKGSLRVAVVSEGVAKHFFPQDEPIGKRIRNQFQPDEWLTIVGVVGEVRVFDQEQEAIPHLYQSYLQAGTPLMSVVVKAPGDPSKLVEAVRTQATTLDPSQPFFSIMTLERRLAATLDSRRSYMGVLGAFAALALGLAAVGVYGVLSFFVAQRTHEIGIRMALGGDQSRVLTMVLRQGLGWAGAGVLVGLLAGSAMGRVVASQLYEVSALDPVTFASVAVLLMGVASLACWLPARRAASVDPMIALRAQ